MLKTKLAVSNIAWDQSCDGDMYTFLAENGFRGLEIAPTRIFPEYPYEHRKEAERFAHFLNCEYGISIPSIQSIWFGRTENMFSGSRERNLLMEHTKKAILFAEALNSPNIVFGCPKNRNQYHADQSALNDRIAEEFFGILGDFASLHGTVIAIEANPAIYGTNYINTTQQALELVHSLDNSGFRVNLDTGTMLENKEPAGLICQQAAFFSHVHLSMPHLLPLTQKTIFSEVKSLLEKQSYSGYYSIEMKNTGDITDIKKAVAMIGNCLAQEAGSESHVEADIKSL